MELFSYIGMVLNGTSQKSSAYKFKENYSAWWYVNKALTIRGLARWVRVVRSPRAAKWKL